MPFFNFFLLSVKKYGTCYALQCSCLENPRDGRAWWAAVYGVARSWTRLKWLSTSSSYITRIDITYMWILKYHYTVDTKELIEFLKMLPTFYIGTSCFRPLLCTLRINTEICHSVLNFKKCTMPSCYSIRFCLFWAITSYCNYYM